MGILNPDPKKKSSKDLGRHSLLMAVPAILIAGPLIGILGGQWIDGKFGTNPIFLLIGLIMGFVSAGLEIYKLIKKVEQIDKDKDKDKDVL